MLNNVDFACSIKSIQVWILNHNFLVSKNASSEFWCWKAKPVPVHVFFSSLCIWFCVFCQAGMICRDTFKLSMSIDYTFGGIWNEFVRLWTKQDIKATTVFLFGRLKKMEHFWIFYNWVYYHPIVFVRHSSMHDNVLGIKIIGKSSMTWNQRQR